MNCARIRRQLPALLAGELPAPAAAAVREHLRQCRGCRQQGSQHLQARQALRSAPVPALDEAFFTDLQAAVLREVAALPPARHRRRHVYGAAAAAALFLLGLCFVPGPEWGRLGKPVDGPSGPVATVPRVGSPSLQPLGGTAAVGVEPAPFSQGMMGRAMLPQLIEVDLLGLGTLRLDTVTLDDLRPTAPTLPAAGGAAAEAGDGRQR